MKTCFFQEADTYVWIKYKYMFARLHETIASLEAFFKIIDIKRLGRIIGENLVYFAKKTLAVGKCLHILGNLPEQMVINVFTVLTKCFCKHFKTFSKLYL